ncbi:shikimate dehydrogenase [Pseudomonas sp. ABFPK]|uniref:shikimate dehydrogenase family protein n=1 Tax=Pseudomonas sp. ABFPK TaxID=1636605 RepID=UPI000778BB13|nr:shikimate dehydrogenase [Pseudomonas sp. ABFPK]KYC16322.1 shikimate dehydrogenase [Pseudomonas sp. ABFPK]
MTNTLCPVTGKTRVLAILADPIHHVKTPEDMNNLMTELGLDQIMVPFHVRPENLASVVAGLRGIESLDGFIVTVPHKSSIIELCDTLSPAAKMVGAANVVRRTNNGLHGDILDGVGFVAGLRNAGINPEGKTAYLAGAGGAANAIAFSLAENGIKQLTIANRTRSKAELLVLRLREIFPTVDFRVGSPDASGHELVINATSMGLNENDPYPLNVESLTADQIVAEIIMQPEYTSLLKYAEKLGCKIHFGRPMLKCQIEYMAQAMGIDTQTQQQNRVQK